MPDFDSQGIFTDLLSRLSLYEPTRNEYGVGRVGGNETKRSQGGIYGTSIITRGEVS